jgi:CubicO group peptidase (beta-lactamase class C family)
VRQFSVFSVSSVVNQLAVLATVAGLAAPEAEAQRLDTASLRRAAEYSEAERGIAMLVMVDGRIIFEHYPKNGSPGKTHLLASGTKSFAGILAAAAVQDSLLTYDEPVANTIQEWAMDPRKSGITIRQLLDLSSGIDGGPQLTPPSYAQAVSATIAAGPTEQFLYGPVPFQLFGEIMKRKLSSRGETVGAYLSRRILTPLDIKPSFWRGLPQGEPQLPHGAYLSAREWVKLGEFVRLKGMWKGTQLIPAEHLAELFKGSAVNPAYGMSWWLNVDVPPALRRQITQLQNNFGGMERVPGLEGMVTAAGAFKQRLYVIPSRRMVVVRLGNSVGPQFQDARFLGLLTGAITQ